MQVIKTQAQKVKMPLPNVEYAEITFLTIDGLLVPNGMCLTMFMKRITQDDLEDAYDSLSLISTEIAYMKMEAFKDTFEITFRDTLKLNRGETDYTTVEYTSRRYPNVELISPNIERLERSYVMTIFLDGNYGELFDKLDWTSVLMIPMSLSNNSTGNYIRKAYHSVSQ